MSGDPGEAPKIIIDSDWKNEAQAEREKLAEQEKARAEESPEHGMPKADFRGLLGMLASQALMYMGAVADPESGKAIFDPIYAHHMIELLGVLEEKTRGNRTDEESAEIVGVLGELRSRYVELAQMMAQQGAAPGSPGTPGSPGAGPGGPVMG